MPLSALASRKSKSVFLPRQRPILNSAGAASERAWIEAGKAIAGAMTTPAGNKLRESLENANGNSPAPQDFYNLDADFGLSAYHQPYNSTTSIVWSLPFGHGHRWGSGLSGGLDALAGGWQLAGINSLYAGEAVTFVYIPTTPFLVSGIQQDFRGANSYRPNVNGDPYAHPGTLCRTAAGGNAAHRPTLCAADDLAMGRRNCRCRVHFADDVVGNARPD